jgi:predicted  nucleic acid-binding Zn-ribbon protein
MKPDGPAPPADPLSDLLSLASQEGALQGEGLVAFVDALRARARLVLAEYLERQEERLRALEAETADRLRALEAETAWRRESMAALEESTRALGQQAERLSDELRKASDAHGALLAHHREVVDRVATELVAIASLSPVRVRQARRRLRALAELLRVDSR